MKYKSLPETLRQEIEQRLDSDFKKWKVDRLQEQTLPGDAEKRYEIVIKGKDETGATKYEYLFGSDGTVIRKLKILLPSNLINQY